MLNLLVRSLSEMRNLKNVAFEEVESPDSLPLSATAWDTQNDTTICAFGPSSDKPVIELKRKSRWSRDFQTVASWDAPCPLPDLPSDEVVLLQYFADTSTSCLVLAGGDIVVVRDDPLPDQERIEIVGSVDVGIAAAAWAPDEELLAIVTRTDTLVLMSRDFEPVSETTLSAEDLRASKHVSVGWGRKETQFQGKRAKAMRDPTMPENIDEGKPSPCEDGRTCISWRGDGAYFAVNRVVPGHRRAVRVFSRDAVLDSASEPVDGLESALGWRPYGNLIAGVKRSNDKVEVLFFERNGLRHGEFDLRLSKEDVDTWASRTSLEWNIDSSVLAIIFVDRVQLWTMGNYHYYLKQEILVPSHPSRAEMRQPALRWHPETALRLQVRSHASVIDAIYNFDVCRGPVVPPLDCGAVAVTDGKTLKLTPLKQAGIPPPMSFCEVSFNHNIVDCAFSADGEKVAVLTTQTIEFCLWAMQQSSPHNGVATGPGTNRQFLTETTNQALRLPNGGMPRYTQVRFRGDDDIFILAPAQQGTPAQFGTYRIHKGFENAICDTIARSDLPQSLITDIRQSTIWSLDQNETKLIRSAPHDATKAATKSFVGAISDSVIFQTEPEHTDALNGYHENNYHRVSLSPKGTLQADDQILARDCSSFVVTNAHVIFTTTQHLLKFVHLTEPAAMSVPGDTPEVDERCRSIEKGAKIVTVIPSAYAVVLQMPRGNLETIFPRVLVLSGIRRHIFSLRYRTAFLACQTHQVDVNILYDYQSEVFMANVSKFVDELKKPARVDEFISKLKDEDVTQTLYRDTLKDSFPNGSHEDGGSKAHPQQPTGKVNRICDALISVLTSRSSAYLQNIITAHTCKRPPDFTSALSLISTLQGTSTEEADLAISHLCFLTDSNRLYDAALGLYDLEVALLVAQNSQRDPREYMPFLEKLQTLPLLRRQYTIDNHLRNYSRALTSLVSLSEHDEAEVYTIRHSLYPTALDLYKYSPSHLTIITRHYAAYLASTSQPLHAATLYDSLQDHQSAYSLYTLAHAWREALTSATLIPLEPAQLKSLANSLASTLTDETRDYRAAATIHIDYLHDIPAAARLLCRGSYFSDASRTLALHTQAHLVTEIIDPALLDKFSEILSLMSDCRSQLTSQVPRILELRRIKASDPLAFFGGDPTLASGDADVPDNISLAPTDSTLANHSLFTRYHSSNSKFGGTVASNISHRTSKTRRKEERKRARGKKGSVYEEEYLVASVARLFSRVNETHEEVRRLVMGLRRRGMREQSMKVDEVMREMQVGMEKAREEVWPEQEKMGEDGKGGQEGEKEERPRGGGGVFWDSQQGLGGDGGGRKEAPEVKVWKGGEVFAR